MKPFGRTGGTRPAGAAGDPTRAEGLPRSSGDGHDRRRTGSIRRLLPALAVALALAGFAGLIAPRPAAAYQPGAHYCLVMNVAGNLPDGNIFKTAIQTYPRWAAWGSDGPDLPGILPSQMSGRTAWFDATHYQKTGQYVRFLLRESVGLYIQNNRQQEYLKGVAFAAGYATHVAGDMAVHGILVNLECGIAVGSNDHQKDVHHVLEGWADIYTWALLKHYTASDLTPEDGGGPEKSKLYQRFGLDVIPRPGRRAAGATRPFGQSVMKGLIERANREIVLKDGEGNVEHYSFLEQTGGFYPTYKGVSMSLMDIYQHGDYWGAQNIDQAMDIFGHVLQQSGDVGLVSPWTRPWLYCLAQKMAKMYRPLGEAKGGLSVNGTAVGTSTSLGTSRALRTVMAWNQANDMSLRLLTLAGQDDYASGPWATSDAWEPDGALNDGRRIGNLQVTVETGHHKWGTWLQRGHTRVFWNYGPGTNNPVYLLLEFSDDPTRPYYERLDLKGHADFKGGYRDIYYMDYDLPYPISHLTRLEIQHRPGADGYRKWDCRQVSLSVDGRYVYVSDVGARAVVPNHKMVATLGESPLGYDEESKDWNLAPLDPVRLADPSLQMPMAPYAGSSVSRGEWLAEFSSDCGPGLDMNSATVLPGTAQVPVRFVTIPGQYVSGAVTASRTYTQPVNMLKFHLTKSISSAWLRLLVKVDGRTVADITNDSRADYELGGLRGHTVQFVLEAANIGRALDDWWAEISNIRVYSAVDVIPPTTTVSGADDQWHSSPVTLTFTAVDDEDGSGVDYTEYRVNGGAWTRGTTVTISDEGDNTVDYRSADIAGNVETYKTCHVKIGSGDTIPPTTTVSGADDAWHNAAVTLTFSAVDNSGGSGVAYTEYRVDGGSWVRGTSVSVPDAGDNTVDYRSADVAGNLETYKTCHVKIDKTAPSVSLTPSVPPVLVYDGVSYWNTVTFTVDATDAGGSGVNGIMIMTESETEGGWETYRPWAAANTATFAWNTTGTGRYRLNYYAVDVAGNAGAPQQYVFGIRYPATAPPLGVVPGAALPAVLAGR